MTIPACQREVADFLARLAGCAPRETHISAVFVGQDVAYKLKKAVRLAYLDFSALSQRRHFAERELAVNRIAAPEIYRDVVAVERGGDGALRLVAEGEATAPLDFVLRMTPVPACAFLDKAIGRGGVDGALADALGDCVARDHAARPVVVGWDSAAGLARAARECVSAARSAGLDGALTASWDAEFSRALAGCEDWLAARAGAGFVRRCHGDLHAGNIVLWQGRPLPFDALEFDEALATIDVAYDLAFLLMDLERRAGRAAANRVFNRYIARTGDAGAAQGMGTLMSLRAFVRAMAEQSRGCGEVARAYLDDAFAHLRPAHKVMVAVGGLPGTGKSTLARVMAPKLGGAPGAVVLRSDEVRKRMFGVAPEETLDAAAYVPAVHEAVMAKLVADARRVLQGGGAVIADATFMEAADREAVEQAGGEDFVGLWMDVAVAEAARRIRARRGDASDADEAVLAAAAARGVGDVRWLRIADEEAALAALSARNLTATANKKEHSFSFPAPASPVPDPQAD